MAFSTAHFEAIGMQLTGDELWFQHFSSLTHPTGYAWKEKQVKWKVEIIVKKCQNKPWEAVNLITVHLHKSTSILTCEFIFETSQIK